MKMVAKRETVHVYFKHAKKGTKGAARLSLERMYIAEHFRAKPSRSIQALNHKLFATTVNRPFLRTHVNLFSFFFFDDSFYSIGAMNYPRDGFPRLSAAGSMYTYCTPSNPREREEKLRRKV